MRKSLLLQLFFLTAIATSAQLKDYKRLGVFFRQTINTNSSVAEMSSLSYSGFGMDVYKGYYEERKLTYSLRNRVIGDFVSIILPGNVRKITEIGPEITSGLIGWWNIGHSVFRTQNLNIAPGIALHDYIYTSGTIEPNGYYFSAGPCVIVDYALGGTPFILHFESSYVASTRVNAQDEELGENYDKDAEDPHFINLQVELRYEALFFGVSPVWMINRYAPTQDVQRGSRLDIMVGFRI